MPAQKKPPPVAPEPKVRRTLSPEHRENLRRANTGRKHTDATKAKLREAAARRREAKATHSD